jgi:anthranilate phosphoribosyltransferase
VGGGSNAIGMFDAFIGDPTVRLVGAEPGGHKPEATDSHGLSINKGSAGILHGSLNLVLQTEAGQCKSTHSVSAGLDYPGVSPVHCFLSSSGRADYVCVDDTDAFGGLQRLAETEGIICALETAHAVKCAMDLAPTLGRHEHIIVSLSGRGDKDMGIITEFSAASAGVQRIARMADLLADPSLVTAGIVSSEMQAVISDGVEAVLESDLHDLRTNDSIFHLFDAFNAAVATPGEEVHLLAAVLLEFRTALLLRCSAKDILEATLAPHQGCDIVGTGGDKKNTHNVSTPAGLLAAATGMVNVIKHGNVSASSASGSADVLDALGADTELAANAAVMTQSRSAGGTFAFLFARLLHPTIGKFSALRRKYGKRTFFNVLGPLLNPFIKHGVYGVTQRKVGLVYASVLQAVMKSSGVGRAWVVMSEDGVDKVAPYATTECWDITAVEVSHSFLPALFSRGEDVANAYEGGGGPAQNASRIVEALSPGSGEQATMLREFIIANAAAVLVVCGKSASLSEACTVLQATIESGDALRSVDRYVYQSNHLGKKQGVLNRIVAHVSLRKVRSAPTDVASIGPPRSLFDALRARHGQVQASVIAEIKLRSPTYTACRHTAEALADAYLSATPSPVAISVLTEPTFFGGRYGVSPRGLTTHFHSRFV